MSKASREWKKYGFSPYEEYLNAISKRKRTLKAYKRLKRIICKKITTYIFIGGYFFVFVTYVIFQGHIPWLCNLLLHRRLQRILVFHKMGLHPYVHITIVLFQNDWISFLEDL